jgi:hypothetical protein
VILQGEWLLTAGLLLRDGGPCLDQIRGYCNVFLSGCYHSVPRRVGVSAIGVLSHSSTESSTTNSDT